MNEHALGRLLARRNAHHDIADRVATTPIRDPRGGITTVADALARMEKKQREIDDIAQAGSRYHHRISTAQRRLVHLLPLLDGLILLWFLTGVLNVDLTRFDPTLAIAAALALLCTAGVAAFNTVVGQHLQRSKDRHTADLVWDHLDLTSWILLALGIAMASLLGVMMDVRVSDEVFQATGVLGGAAAIIALTVAAATVLVNLAVIYLSYRDGSPLTHELDQLAHSTRHHLSREHQARARAQATTRRIHIRVAAHHRVGPPTLPNPDTSTVADPSR